MRISFQNRVGETITRHSWVGQKLVGLRLTEMVFETSNELSQLTTEEGQRWLKSIAHVMKRYTEAPIKDTNWGSDWVDDGV